MAFEFEYDARKARENFAKHGISFEEAVTVFRDPLAKIFDDEEHSSGEQREIIIGHSARHRLLLVCFADRPARVRLISARQVTPLEREDYEEKARRQ